MTPTATEARTLYTQTVTEKKLMEAIIEAAHYLGYHCYHTYDSRRSPSGFPDLTLLKGGRLIFAELKSERGKVSAAQQVWIDALQVAGIEAYVVFPDQQDWFINEVLAS